MKDVNSRLRRIHVRGNFSADASFDDLLHRPTGVRTKEASGTRQGIGDGIRALKQGVKDPPSEEPKCSNVNNGP